MNRRSCFHHSALFLDYSFSVEEEGEEETLGDYSHNESLKVIGYELIVLGKQYVSLAAGCELIVNLCRS